MKNGGMRKMHVSKITKAIYGSLLGAVVFYNKLKGVLVDLGFKMNEFNECTFNKMINGYQCTIQMHVIDLKLSNVQQEELNKIINQLNAFFRSEG